MCGRALVAALVVVISSAAAHAEIIVNAAQPISHRVTVQLIQTALDNGTSPATVFGNSSQRADIEAAIDEIWAQAGIDVAILPNVTRYNDTFAYQGNNGSNTRRSGDFNTIFSNARNEGGILHADSLVLNLILVDIVPAFKPLGDNSAAGYARVQGNGIIGYVGENLLTWGDGRDVIASVMAHEIGHNLGLNHTANGGANLMSPQGTTEQLNSSQISTARSSSFAQMIAVQLAGDYNDDGTVDAADYSVWRNTLGKTGSGLAADGNNNGRIDPADYAVWKDNYGNPFGAGGMIGALADTSLPAIVLAPEPNSIVYAAALLSLLVCSRCFHPGKQ